MRVRLYEPGKPYKWIEIENDLHTLQEIVGGFIETLTISEDAVIICNEEGKINGMEPNRNVWIRGRKIDTIFGPFLVAGCDCERFVDAPDMIPELKTRPYPVFRIGGIEKTSTTIKKGG
ncbi:MAG: DUF3846 domain-containing protein [Bacillota bacterium]|jgi:hypothetical protein